MGCENCYSLLGDFMPTKYSPTVSPGLGFRAVYLSLKQEAGTNP